MGLTPRIHLRHLQGEYVLRTSREPMRAGERPLYFSDAGAALRFIGGLLLDGDAGRELGRLYHQLDVGAFIDLTTEQIARAIASQLAAGNIRVAPVEVEVYGPPVAEFYGPPAPPDPQHKARYETGVVVSSERLRIALDTIAAEQKRTLIVYSGDRSPERNQKAGGAPKSAHLRGEAADVIFDGLSKVETADALFHSAERKKHGVRLLYHRPGAALPEHSHLDLNEGPDIQEQPKGSVPRYVPMQDPMTHE